MIRRPPKATRTDSLGPYQTLVRPAHAVEARQERVELDRARFAVDLVHRQTQRHAHEERLRQFEARLVAVDEVAVVQRLQAEVVEHAVALGEQRLAERSEERRVGKECVSTCRSRWSPYH